MELGTVFIQYAMKRFLVVMLLLYFVKAQAQKDDSQLISRHRPGLLWYFDGLRPTGVSDNRKYDRLIFDLTYNDWIGDLNPFHNRWSSIGFNTSFMNDLKFKKTKGFSLGVGVGYGFSSISSGKRFLVDKHLVELVNIEKSGIYDHASIHAHRFYIPIEFRFNTKNWNRLKFAIGCSFGINTGLNQSLIGRDGSKQGFTNLKTNSTLLNYGLHCRFGLRNFAVFTSYQINGFFREPTNPNLHQLQFGFSDVHRYPRPLIF
jgi:hypothetical protein